VIELKTEAQIELMRQAGKILAKIAQELRPKIKAGITTQEIDNFAESLFEREGVVSAFKGYRGFPANTCISVNEEVVHGIPSDRKLKEGDIVSLDLGLKKEGYFADMAFTVGVGKVSGNLKKLMEATKKALDLGIREAKANNRIMDISYAIQSQAESKGFSVVRDFVGHGIGTNLHEDPEVPNFGKPHTGQLIKEGLVLAIETMVNMGSWEVRLKDNGWTAVTKDRLPSAHFEHTVAITKSGPQILTQ
jgi:methionine aminopeptidase, type I (EC 3.4.11.18)